MHINCIKKFTACMSEYSLLAHLRCALLDAAVNRYCLARAIDMNLFQSTVLQCRVLKAMCFHEEQ